MIEFDYLNEIVRYVNNDTNEHFKNMILTTYNINDSIYKYLKGKDKRWITYFFALINKYTKDNLLNKSIDNDFLNYVYQQCGIKIDDEVISISNDNLSYSSEDIINIELHDDVIQFKFKENQIDAITKISNMMISKKINGKKMLLPESSICCQATGCGKTFIGINIVKYIAEKNNYRYNLTFFWFTERKDIILNQFFTKRNGVCVKKSDNYKLWKKWQIIDMDKFDIHEFVDNKDPKWYEKINKNTKKPKIIFINRAFLTQKNLYQKIKNNIPAIIIHDEMHSATNDTTFRFFNHVIDNWNSSILGFSATPIRVTHNNKYNPKEYNRLLKIYPGENGTLNVNSEFNIVKAILHDLIVKPKFKIMKLKEITVNTNFMVIGTRKTSIPKSTFFTVMRTLNKVYIDLPYGKIIGWCGLINETDDWKILFDKFKMIKTKKGLYKYTNLVKLESYVDHSQNDDEDFIDFNNSKNGILFCANKHREGSDIPYLDCCIFLDTVKDRSVLVFIQSIGRVLRKDPNGKKQYGMIIDSIMENTKKSIEDLYFHRILEYYEYINNLTLNFENFDEGYDKYKKIMKDIVHDTNTDFFSIKLGNSNIDIECYDFEWKLSADDKKMAYDKCIRSKIGFTKKQSNEIDKLDITKHIIVTPISINSKSNYNYEKQYFETGNALWSGTSKKDEKKGYRFAFCHNANDRMEIFVIEDILNSEHSRSHWDTNDRNVIYLSKKICDIKFSDFIKMNNYNSGFKIQGSCRLKWNDKLITNKGIDFPNITKEIETYESKTKKSNNVSDDEPIKITRKNEKVIKQVKSVRKQIIQSEEDETKSSEDETKSSEDETESSEDETESSEDPFAQPKNKKVIKQPMKNVVTKKESTSYSTGSSRPGTKKKIIPKRKAVVRKAK